MMAQAGPLFRTPWEERVLELYQNLTDMVGKEYEVLDDEEDSATGTTTDD